MGGKLIIGGEPEGEARGILPFSSTEMCSGGILQKK
jgi:hypothetical protein